LELYITSVSRVCHVQALSLFILFFVEPLVDFLSIRIRNCICILHLFSIIIIEIPCGHKIAAKLVLNKNRTRNFKMFAKNIKIDKKNEILVIVCTLFNNFCPSRYLPNTLYNHNNYEFKQKAQTVKPRYYELAQDLP